jgi:uncharacterized protein (DUF2141 family)
MKTTAYQIAVFATLSIAALGSQAQSIKTTIQVDVDKIKNAKGMMACALFNVADGFPDVQAKSFQYVYVSINSGLANCEFKDIAAGTYAVSVFHDENDNKKLDKNFVGVPLEGYGVSNNIRHMMSAPEFKESSFQVNGEVDKNIKIRMGY